MLSLEHVSLSRGGKTIVKDVSVTVKRGELAALRGPNGAGKTTLLHYIAGFLKSDSGEVRYRGGKAAPGSREWRNVVTYVLDDGGTIPLLTAEEQLTLQCLLCGLDRAEAGERTDRVINLLGLEKHRAYRGDELSSGLRKRLGLGLGIIRDAEVYLFDEPFNGLDVEGAAVLGRIFNLLKNSGRIVLVASHSFPFFSELCRRVWFFEGGGVSDVTDEGSVLDLLDTAYDSGSFRTVEDAVPWIRMPV